jgi:acyl-CoA reductase-like NAD-dependent aldehyde dehydrogenase
MRVWKEEVFGPVLPVVTFTAEEEAIKLANDTMYGLGAYVFTQDTARYLRVAKQLQSGLVAHNNALYFSTSTPFGGYKASGNSRTLGLEGFHEVTQIKVISEEK